MKTMMVMAGALTVLAATASAQYGQPVKEVEKEARSAVTGTVSFTVQQAGSNHELAGKMVEAPPGKILAIRWVSAICQGPTGLSLGYVELWTAAPFADYTLLPLQPVVSPYTNAISRILSTPVYLNVKSGVGAYFRAVKTQTIPVSSFCTVTYQGFLLDN